MKRFKKWTAFFLAAILIFSLLAPAALAAENTVSIRTADDLAALAQKCSLDAWSQGKTVILENDISLRDTEFTPIPTFGGAFQGNGHTISGLRIAGSGNVRGLFRYIQSGGVVKDLSVEGTVAPEDRQDDLGLLAGNNAGKILNCTASGTVAGGSRIGGIVGKNEKTGELVGCSFSGTVTGKHSAGGIVGENSGTLTRCENSGSINTRDLEDDLQVDYPNLDDLNSMENIPTYTDIGGIAGLSDGTLQNCTNSGDVGYDHIGFNVGGIVGRQSGWLDGCVNTGTIRGRKDVGGIAGQLEPEVIQMFSEDFLDRLLTRLDSLQDEMDRLSDDTSGISDQVHDQINDLSDKASVTKETTKELSDAMTDWANGNIDQVNELSARVSRSLDELDDIMDDAVDMMDNVDDLMDELERVRKTLVNAAGSGSSAAGNLQDAITELEQVNQDLQDAVSAMRKAAEKILEALGNGDDIHEGLQELIAAAEKISRALNRLNNVLDSTKKALKDLEDAGDDVKRALEELEDVHDAAQDVIDKMSDVTEGLRDMIHELSEDPDIRFESIGDDITDKGDQLENAIDALLDSGDALNQLLSDSTDTVISDLKSINKQIRAITDLIRSEKNDRDNDRGKSVEDQIRDHFEDVSDTCDLKKQHDGRISSSENQGTVQGDTQVGGITGSICIETDFDVDEDAAKVGDYSTELTYQAKALVYACVNNGDITAKNDYAGGIAGNAWFGWLSVCESYGAVTSTDGSYVGGLAGAFDGNLDRSWVKCALSGTDYVGGAAGYGDIITDCRTLVTVTGDAYTGAIAGDVDEDGSISGCVFTSNVLGAIDGISYIGKAEPVGFEELCVLNGVPKAFSQLQLTFRADGKVLAVIPFQYGRGIDSLPEIPAKKGCFAVWPDLDYRHLTASMTLDAIYTPYRSSVTDGSGTVPQLLVSGSFSSRAEVAHTAESASWVDQQGRTYTGDAVTVRIDDSDMKEISYTVHYRLPDTGKRYDLWIKTEAGWEKQESTVDGNYLLFTDTAETVTFCIQERTHNTALILCLSALAALVLLAAIYLLCKKRGRPPRNRRLKQAADCDNAHPSHST